MSDVEEVLPPTASRTPQPGPSGKYKYVCSIAEAPTSSERYTTYGVQFAWRPCKDYLQGGGSFWQGRRTLNPDKKLSGSLSKQANSDDDDDDDDDDEEDDENDDEPNEEKDGEVRVVETVDVDAEDMDSRQGNLNGNVNGHDVKQGSHHDSAMNAVEDVEIVPQRPKKHSRSRARPAVTRTNEAWRNIFVTCNGNAVRIYEARLREKPRCLQRYEDDDTTEQFYCVGWTYNVDGQHEWWACAAGRKGVLRVLNVHSGLLHQSLAGHGEAINDLKVHPRDPALVLTASKDESLRLWNLRTGVTIAVFAGLKGHRGEVVFTDFNRDGSKFASCGIDNSIRIWDIYDDERVVTAIKDSHHVADLGVEDPYVYVDETGTRQKTKVTISQFPCFVTRKVHKHYVDCVMWVGDLLLSKSVHNRIFLWEPEADRETLASPACNYSLLEEYVLDVCNIWFIRFAMDRSRRLVACGNDKGLVSIFNLDVLPAKTCCRVQPPNKNMSSNYFVRQCAFSDDQSILIAVDDNATVVQYEAV